MDWKSIDQGVPRRKPLKNMVFGSPNMFAQSYGRGSTFEFDHFVENGLFSCFPKELAQNQ